MDLSERAKLKQDIVRETGCKSAIYKPLRTICNDKYSKCYSDSENMMFETTILGETLVYILSGLPSEPVVHASCLSEPGKSFDIHSEIYLPELPEQKDDIAEWLSFCRYMNSRIIVNRYAVSYDNYIPEPNKKAAIEKSHDSWYLCISDENNVLDISGSFSENTMAYILADKEQKSYLQEYKYNDIEKEKYIYVHHRNLADIRGMTLNRIFSYKNRKYEICEWRDGIKVKNLKDNNDVRYIYGLDIDTPSRVSGLNGQSYDVDELFRILTEMFNDNTVNWIPYAKSLL